MPILGGNLSSVQGEGDPEQFLGENWVILGVFGPVVEKSGQIQGDNPSSGGNGPSFGKGKIPIQRNPDRYGWN